MYFFKYSVVFLTYTLLLALFVLVAGIVVKLSRILVIMWACYGEICNNS